jgi:hypothetical protein
MKSKPLANRWAHLLGVKVEQTIPDDFKTVEQVAQEIGLSKVRTQDRLYQAAKAKKISRVKGRNAEGRVCWFYGEK